MEKTAKRTRIGAGLARSGVAGWLMAPLLVALLGIAPLGVAQADSPNKKLQREVRIFERAVDEMLIDSPNWLVPGRKNTRGYYVPGHGIIFTFQTSLVDRDWGRKFSINWGWWDDDSDRHRRDRDREDDDKDMDEKKRDRAGSREERLYERGKQEIIDVLQDFGDVFESVNANELVTVVAYLDGADLFWDEGIRQLEMSAKVSDLRAAAAGSLSEEELQKRIQVQQY